MSDKCERHNSGKPQLSYNLLGREVSEGEASVWEFGATKYKRGNWLKGAPFTQAVDSLLRHATKFLNGEDLDGETGLPHVDHIVCCAKILSNSYHTRRDLDDRGAVLPEKKPDEVVKKGLDVDASADTDINSEFKMGDIVERKYE